LDENKKANKPTLDLSWVVSTAWMRAKKSSIDPNLLQLMLLRKNSTITRHAEERTEGYKEPG
jgi:hypothetical protein